MGGRRRVARSTGVGEGIPRKPAVAGEARVCPLSQEYLGLLCGFMLFAHWVSGQLGGNSVFF